MSVCHKFSLLSNTADGEEELDISGLLEVLGKVKDPHMVNISERPAEADDRAVPGFLERRLCDVESRT